MINTQFCKTFVFRRFSLKRSHRADFSENGIERNYFGIILKGNCTMKTYGKTLHLKEGDLFFIPMHCHYTSCWTGNESEKIEWLSFGFALLPIVETLCYGLQKIETANCAPLFEIAKDMAVTPKSVGLLYRFIDAVLPKMEPESRGSHQTVEKATALIYGNPQLKISQIASLCNISESKLYQLFSKYTDSTPNAVRIAAICEKATELLLTTDKSVEQICSDVNVSSTSYLRKLLKAYCGETPLKIRKSRSNIQ